LLLVAAKLQTFYPEVMGVLAAVAAHRAVLIMLAGLEFLIKGILAAVVIPLVLLVPVAVAGLEQ
jgi:hypothetical protein